LLFSASCSSAINAVSPSAFSLPMPPVVISLPYTQQLIFLSHHGIGSPALDRLSSTACRPATREKTPALPFSQRMPTGLPQLTRGMVSQNYTARGPEPLNAPGVRFRPSRFDPSTRRQQLICLVDEIRHVHFPEHGCGHFKCCSASSFWPKSLCSSPRK